jgi:Ribonuclease G/E
MTRRILAESSPGEVRVAVIRDGLLTDYAIWRPGAPDGVGDVYRGRVITRAAAMAGAFIALGNYEGFLPDNQGADGLSDGDIVTVRIVRAAQGGKGPRLAVDASTLLGDGSPALLSRGSGALVELAERHAEAPILLDDAALAARLQGRFATRIRLVPVAFDDAVLDEVQTLGEPTIELPQNGRLHVYPTPALVAIDVDAGGAVASRQGKMAAHMAANRAALPELVRQIRLRNLSGAILVDFAGLSPRRRATLHNELQSALADDPLRPRLLGFTALGLAEIVRPRVHPPLHELQAGSHAAGLAALRRLAAEAVAQPHRNLTVRAAPIIINAVQADTEAAADIERRMGRTLILRADPTLAVHQWVIEPTDA